MNLFVLVYNCACDEDLLIFLFCIGINAALGNMTEDDGSWHMYDTVKGSDWLGIFLFSQN